LHQLIERMKPVLADLRNKKTAESKDGKEAAPVSWLELAGAAKGAGLNLQAVGHYAGGGPDSLRYSCYGAAVSEVEVDVLTGETQTLASHLLYDAGKSLNPVIDIGQVEGAYVFGMGFFLRETVEHDAKGALVTNGTWKYKIPSTRDVPIHFSVELLQDTKFEPGVLSSKATGEPPLVLAASVILAVRQAIASARKDAGAPVWFDLPTPATPDVIQRACAGDESHFTVN